MKEDADTDFAAEVTGEFVGRLDGVTLHGQAAHYAREVLTATDKGEAADALLCLLQVLGAAGGGRRKVLAFFYASVVARAFRPDAGETLPAMHAALKGLFAALRRAGKKGAGGRKG